MPEVRQSAQAMRLANVFTLGHVSEEQKTALLRKCRAVVLPSHLRSEAYGMVLVEASLCAKPMISCEIGTGTSYVNLDGVTGFVVAPRNAASLGRAMRQLIEDEELALRLGSAARARYEELFSGEAFGMNHLAFYQEALSSGKEAGAKKSIK